MSIKKYPLYLEAKIEDRDIVLSKFRYSIDQFNNGESYRRPLMFQEQSTQRLQEIRFVDYIKSDSGRYVGIKFKFNVGYDKWSDYEIKTGETLTLLHKYEADVYIHERGESESRKYTNEFTKRITLKVIDYVPYPFVVKSLVKDEEKYYMPNELGSLSMKFVGWIRDIDEKYVGMKVLEDTGSGYGHGDRFKEADLYVGKEYEFFNTYTHVEGGSDWEDWDTGYKFCLVPFKDAVE